MINTNPKDKRKDCIEEEKESKGKKLLEIEEDAEMLEEGVNKTPEKVAVKIESDVPDLDLLYPGIERIDHSEVKPVRHFHFGPVS